MTEEEEKYYLSCLNKIIKCGNPKYLSYISKEYMKVKDANPQIALAITCMIQKEATEDKSVYAIFLDNDGSININAMSDISKITEIDQFVSTVQDLSQFDVDFSDMSADELIIEGEAIAEQLAAEAESLENEINNISVDETTNIEATESDITNKSNEIMSKAVGFAAVSAAAAAIVTRIKGVLARISSSLTGKKQEQENVKAEKTEQEKEDEDKKNILNSAAKKVKEKVLDDSFCPKVKIDVEKAVEDTERENMLREQKREEAKQKGLTTDDSVDDNPADDFLDF